MRNIIKKLVSSKDKKVVANITLDNIRSKMYEVGLTKEFVEEVMIILEDKFHKDGEQQFQEWLSGLNYRLPTEFKDELLAIEIYEKHPHVIEEQLKELEKETKLSWEIQSEDLKNTKDEARKVQLVLRDRLSGIALDLLT